MTSSKALEHALALSRLAGVSTSAAVYLYAQGRCGVLVDSEMTGRLVVLVNEEAVVMWKHNHEYWMFREERGDGTAATDHG